MYNNKTTTKMINADGARLLKIKFVPCRNHKDMDLWIKPDGTIIYDVMLGDRDQEIVKNEFQDEFELWKEHYEENELSWASGYLWEDCFLIDAKKWCHFSSSLKYFFWKELTDEQRLTIKKELNISDLP